MLCCALPCYVLATGLVSSGQLTKTLAFLTKHPDALGAIMLLSCAASCGECGWHVAAVVRLLHSEQQLQRLQALLGLQQRDCDQSSQWQFCSMQLWQLPLGSGMCAVAPIAARHHALATLMVLSRVNCCCACR